MTDIPIVKSFVHSLIMSIFQSCESCYVHVHSMCLSHAQHVLIIDLLYIIHVLKLIIGFGSKNICNLPFYVIFSSLSLIDIVLVDPGRLEIDLMSSGPKSTADNQSSSENIIIIIKLFFHYRKSKRSINSHIYW